jgi:hypothetical protein
MAKRWSNLKSPAPHLPKMPSSILHLEDATEGPGSATFPTTADSAALAVGPEGSLGNLGALGGSRSDPRRRTSR